MGQMFFGVKHEECFNAKMRWLAKIEGEVLHASGYVKTKLFALRQEFLACLIVVLIVLGTSPWFVKVVYLLHGYKRSSNVSDLVFPTSLTFEERKFVCIIMYFVSNINMGEYLHFLTDTHTFCKNGLEAQK